MSIEFEKKVRLASDATAMKVQAEPVNIKAGELARMLAEMDAGDQATLLVEGSAVTKEWWWAMQCRNIVDLLTEGERRSVADCLDTLIDHLRENCDRRTIVQRPILCRCRMPEQDATVIVAGGIAAWTASGWISRMHGAGDSRPITWPVLWWMPFPTDETAIDVSERPQPPCQV